MFFNQCELVDITIQSILKPYKYFLVRSCRTIWESVVLLSLGFVKEWLNMAKVQKYKTEQKGAELQLQNAK